jgi:DNA-binding NarL/FixJ family response regulator
MIRIAIIDDHLHVAIALHAMLDKMPDFRLVGEARRGGQAASLIRQTHPDVLLLDLFVEPEFDALSAVRRLRADFPNLKICILSAYLEPLCVRDLLQAGVDGYIIKDDDYVTHIDTILHDLVEGRIYLSPQAHDALAQATRERMPTQTLSERETDILRLAKRGLPNPQIAQSLHLSAGTVRNHLSAIYTKLGVHSRYEALQVAAEQHLI